MTHCLEDRSRPGGVQPIPSLGGMPGSLRLTVSDPGSPPVLARIWHERTSNASPDSCMETADHDSSEGKPTRTVGSISDWRAEAARQLFRGKAVIGLDQPSCCHVSDITQQGSGAWVAQSLSRPNVSGAKIEYRSLSA